MGKCVKSSTGGGSRTFAWFYCGSNELRDVDKRVIRLQKEQVNELNFCHEWLHKYVVGWYQEKKHKK